MIIISQNLKISDNEIEVEQIPAQGPGGQNVNKVATAVHLRFDITASALPENCKQKLLKLNDNRLTKSGIIVIKSQCFRSFEKNKEEAINRLIRIIKSSFEPKRKRKPTKPPLSSNRKRLDHKTKHSLQKKMRKKLIIGKQAYE
ncbi:MAG: aminoacyl-tRNA hydrolase [Victivallales bacterium]|nr:aminoacyl-tRNA hydrolase [Victivallales bacterium]